MPLDRLLYPYIRSKSLSHWCGADICMHTAALIAIASASAVIRKRCVKCVANQSGKANCCDRGGAWFEKCGDVGDTNFEHTWAEGIQACKGNKLVSRVCISLSVDCTRYRVIDMIYLYRLGAFCPFVHSNDGSHYRGRLGQS